MTEAEMLAAIGEFGAKFADVVEVDEWQINDRLRSITFEPTNPNAASATLFVSAWDVVLQVGTVGRFELDLDDEPLEILRAIAEGRAEEATNLLGTTFRVVPVDRPTRKPKRWFAWKLLKGSTRRYAAWRSVAG